MKLGKERRNPSPPITTPHSLTNNTTVLFSKILNPRFCSGAAQRPTGQDQEQGVSAKEKSNVPEELRAERNEMWLKSPEKVVS